MKTEIPKEMRELREFILSKIDWKNEVNESKGVPYIQNPNKKWNKIE